MNTRDKLLTIYAIASGGNQEAYSWLIAWHSWVHRIDDFIDEEGHFATEVVDLCADAFVLMGTEFYRRHYEAISPVVAMVASQYKHSLQSTGKLHDCLRIAGNQMVLLVAYLCGGRHLQDEVAKALWPIVEETQLKGD